MVEGTQKISSKQVAQSIIGKLPHGNPLKSKPESSAFVQHIIDGIQSDSIRGMSSEKIEDVVKDYLSDHNKASNFAKGMENPEMDLKELGGILAKGLNDAVALKGLVPQLSDMPITGIMDLSSNLVHDSKMENREDRFEYMKTLYTMTLKDHKPNHIPYLFNAVNQAQHPTVQVIQKAEQELQTDYSKNGIQSDPHADALKWGATYTHQKIIEQQKSILPLFAVASGVIALFAFGVMRFMGR